MQNTSTLSHQPHPFGHYIPDTAKTLIIGTFPPPEHRWAFRFFYPNKTNLMWQILFKLAKAEDRQEDAVDLRKEVLKKLRVGITDMGHTIQRKSNNAYDENLVLVQAMNILELLEKNPSITRVILTSSSGPVSATRWFLQHLKENNINIKIPSGKKPIQFAFQFKDREYKAHILYSPSRRAAGRISIDKLVEMYGGVIND